MAARVVLLGSDPIALPAFEAVAALSGVTVVGVWSQPDRPSGRGQAIQPNAVAAWAAQKGFPLYQPEVFDAAEDQRLKDLNVDLAVVMAYGQLLRESTLAVPPLGFVNLHGSLLPALRGATPVEGALALGLTETGITLQQVVRKLDAGPVLATQLLPISADVAREALRAEMGRVAGQLSAQAIPALLAGKLKAQPQDESKATYTRRLRREDAALDFSQPASVLADRIRSLEGWPGSTCVLDTVRLKIGRAEAAPESATGAPGTLLSADATGLCIATGKGILRITELQRPGGKMLPAAAFLAGFKVTVGTQFVSEPMPALVGPRPFPRLAD
jgi:methionyl-tRNA formyltransferase